MRKVSSKIQILNKVFGVPFSAEIIPVEPAMVIHGRERRYLLSA